MKAINVYFDDSDYNKLKKAKGKLSWREFILQLIKKEDKKDAEES